MFLSLLHSLGCGPASNTGPNLVQCRPSLGLYPIVTSQYSSTTLYQDSCHIQWLYF
jgi:hypothetical protein